MNRTPRSVESIVEQQVKRWAQERARRTGPAPKPRPVISMSRQFGARGAELARRVADRLEYQFWDQEILHEIARHAHVSEQLVASFDEHHKVVLAETLKSMMHTGPLGTSEYLRELLRVVRSVAGHGGAVLVGRGAQFLLDPATVLRVRAVCPLDDRVRGLCSRYGVDDAEARRRLAEMDQDRRAFHRDHFDRDVEDPTAYDLVVNTGSIPLERAVDLVIAAYDARFPGARAAATA